MSGDIERRALLALYRNHPATAPGERYNWKARAEAKRQREMLLGWAATQTDETLLDCRNLGPTTLRWIREQTGDPPSPFADLEATIARLRRIEEAARDGMEALIWCSGSPSFAPDGEAREGWVTVAQPAIDALRAALEDR